MIGMLNLTSRVDSLYRFSNIFNQRLTCRRTGKSNWTSRGYFHIFVSFILFSVQEQDYSKDKLRASGSESCEYSGSGVQKDFSIPEILKYSFRNYCQVTKKWVFYIEALLGVAFVLCIPLVDDFLWCAVSWSFQVSCRFCDTEPWLKWNFVFW